MTLLNHSLAVPSIPDQVAPNSNYNYFLFPEDRNVSLLHTYKRHTQIQGI